MFFNSNTLGWLKSCLLPLIYTFGEDEVTRSLLECMRRAEQEPTKEEARLLLFDLLGSYVESLVEIANLDGRLLQTTPEPGKVDEQEFTIPTQPWELL